MQLLIFWDSSAPAGLELPVSRMISELTNVEVRVCPSPVILNGYVGSRQQTDARAVIDSIDLLKHRRDLPSPVLLFCGTDLFIGESSSVFGLARPLTGSAVVSMARLCNSYYGREDRDDDLVDRMVKEGAHEVGHLLGLDHCPDAACIMHNPITLDDLDRKRKSFCPACREQVAILSFRLDTIE